MTIHEQVLQETIAFENAIDSLLDKYAGQWVVFKDGSVESSYSSEDEAYRYALKMFGKLGGYVIAQVLPVKPVPITAGVLYGMSC